MAVIRMELQKSREIRCDPTGFSSVYRVMHT